MRFLIAIVFFLGLSLQVLGQATTSDTGSIPASVTGPATLTGSGTWTSTGTWTRSSSGSVTWTPSPSVSGTGTGTITPTQTYPQPPAPTGLDNFCKNHIISICPGWTDPGCCTFNLYKVYYTLQGSGVVNFALVNTDSTEITNLTPNSVYDVFVQGVDTNIGVWSANSTTVQMITDPADPKKDPTRDIQSFACVQATNAKPPGRIGVSCSWTAAADTVRQINFKVHCVSSTREPLLVRKRWYGAKALGTSVFFAVNRDDATCNVYAHFFYARRPTTRHHAIVTI